MKSLLLGIIFQLKTAREQKNYSTPVFFLTYSLSWVADTFVHIYTSRHMAVEQTNAKA